MPLQFSPHPGAHERRLQRLAGNPLFPDSLRTVSQADIVSARQRDIEELERFQQEFQALLQEAMNLAPNVESDVVLNLKERLDMAYERSSSLMGKQDAVQQALRKLIEVVMRTVRSHAQDDPQALQKLEDEDLARSAHFQLQAFPLVADLLREDGVIEENELVPTLLSASQESLAAAAGLFTSDQLVVLAQQGADLLEQCRRMGHDLPMAWERLREIQAMAAAAPLQQTIN